MAGALSTRFRSRLLRDWLQARSRCVGCEFAAKLSCFFKKRTGTGGVHHSSHQGCFCAGAPACAALAALAALLPP